MLKRVAVMISTYNGEKFLREQIESIEKQKGDFILDLWVRDDGSNDGTIAILKEYAAKGILTWYNGTNQRSAKSFLDLLRHCGRYDYYAFCDQDDVWYADKIARGIAALKKEQRPALYFSNARMVDRNLEDLGRNVYRIAPHTDFDTLAIAGGLLGCTMILNGKLRELLCSGKKPEKLVMHDFYVALVCSAMGGKILYDPVPSMKYRQHEKNVIGVPKGKIDKIKSRVSYLTKEPEVSIAEQAESVLQIYGSQMNLEKRKWLQNVAGYRQKIRTRIALALSTKTKYDSKNKAVSLRAALLLGKR